MADITTLREAVSELVHDGDSVALEGFTHLIPLAAGHELIRQGRRHLTLVVITDLGVLTPDPETRELTLASLHPGKSVADARAATGWELRVADQLSETQPPSRAELAALHALKEAAASGS